MKTFEKDDVVTCYFVIYDDSNIRQIQAWSYSKDMAEMYMDFHKCKLYHLKTVTTRAEELSEVISENIVSQINLYNIVTKNRDPKRKKNQPSKIIPIPATDTEMALIREEESGFMSMSIDYSYLLMVVPYLKDKYQEALNGILLDDVSNAVIHNRRSKRLEHIEMDELLLMAKSLKGHFDV